MTAKTLRRSMAKNENERQNNSPTKQNIAG